MQQNGTFRDESSGTDIMMELYEQELLTNMQIRTKLTNGITQLEAEICDIVDDEADRIMMSQM